MKIYDITVTGTTADWLTATRGNMSLPVFVRKLLAEIANNPNKYNDLTQTINDSVEYKCQTRTTKK
ncbi:hypothetical protein B6J47_29380 [Klebsiella pneumoniae]|uniref:hypothetical protein n=1 Tax=Klebsiella pneumoniae complex TaxID=3390273 RepID=UPI000C7B31DA|nr:MULTISPECIES: hypothetical protein [Klebsiella]PLI44064.1 hypothetical protein B6J47_29380 [Klebsiella pneumoniae]PXH38235.1 hypothetical protein DMR27_19280 [Klebsiella variicola]HBS7154811.1 hypothetical protein [Klebsiella pneumoniae]